VLRDEKQMVAFCNMSPKLLFLTAARHVFLAITMITRGSVTVCNRIMGLGNTGGEKPEAAVLSNKEELSANRRRNGGR